MPRPFTPRKTGVTAQNDEQPIKLQNGFLYPRVQVEQRTHSGDEIEATVLHKLPKQFTYNLKFEFGISLYESMESDI